TRRAGPSSPPPRPAETAVRHRTLERAQVNCLVLSHLSFRETVHVTDRRLCGPSQYGAFLFGHSRPPWTLCAKIDTLFTPKRSLADRALADRNVYWLRCVTSTRRPAAAID